MIDNAHPSILHGFVSVARNFEEAENRAGTKDLGRFSVVNGFLYILMKQV